MRLDIPTGYFLDDHCVFGDPGAGSVLSRSYAVQFPDTSSSDDQALVDIERDLRLMLGSAIKYERIQLSYYTTSDFTEPLARYTLETDRSNTEVCSIVRGELADRFRNRMRDETLIQSRAVLSISSRLPKLVKEDGRKVKGFEDVFRVLARSFDQRCQFFDLLLRQYGGWVAPLDNLGHYKEMLRFWSPGQARQPRYVPEWTRTIEDLCRSSGLSPRREPDHGFYLDGFYFGLLVSKTMPKSTWARTMDSLVSLPLPNLRIVINMCPQAIDVEMIHEASRLTKLVSNVDSKDPDWQSVVGIDIHKERLRRLMTNKTIPFKAQMILVACDRTPDGLDARIEALRAAMGKTGCETFQPSIATSTVSFFNAATPGYGPWQPYPDYWHKMDDAVNVVNMWPASSTPEADLAAADWITDGDQNNLIGGRCFVGSQPIHTACVGSTGDGKSVLLQSITLQAAYQFKFIVVIDDGMSWARTCRALDQSCEPIIVRSNGSQTFNIFQTDGPLTAQHMASATALCHLIVGQHPDNDKDKLRSAILSEAIGEVYGIWYRKWRNANPADYYELCEQAADRLNWPIERVMEMDQNPETEHVLRNLSFADWTPEMFPTLFDLQDELFTTSLQKGPHQELCANLSSLLRPWLRDGRYGKLLDGYSNVDLGSVNVADSDPLKVVHFELGEISKAEADLRVVVGFLITNQVRNHIQGMPKALRKLVVIEEMTAFLKIPNAEEIVTDFYQQFRKLSCQVISVFQQFLTLLKVSPKAAEAIIGNSQAMLLLRNTNPKDLEALSAYLPRLLPQVVRDKLASFPLPESMKGRDDAYAGFILADFTGHEPRYTAGRNVISREVEALTSSSGDACEDLRTNFTKTETIESKS